jgi:hypothetical protein
MESIKFTNHSTDELSHWLCFDVPNFTTVAVVSSRSSSNHRCSGSVGGIPRRCPVGFSVRWHGPLVLLVRCTKRLPLLLCFGIISGAIGNATRKSHATRPFFSPFETTSVLHTLLQSAFPKKRRYSSRTYVVSCQVHRDC